MIYNSWCTKHKTFERETSKGLKWVIQTTCKETSKSYLFRYAYDVKPADLILNNLNLNRNCDPILDRHLNYVSDTLNILNISRPTTRKNSWLILDA